MAFPTDIGASTYFGEAYNNLATTLSQEASASATTIYVASTTNFPSIGWATCEDEVFSYTGKTSGSFTGCTRGADNTTAAVHASGKAVSLTLPAVMWTRLVADLRAVMTKLGTGADLDADTLDSKDSADFNQLSANQTIDSKKTYDEGCVIHAPKVYTPDAAGTATLDLSLGNNHEITMPAGNITIAISNETDGQYFTIDITQDGTGSRTVTWFSTIDWGQDGAPTLSTGADRIDSFGFKVTGTDTYRGYVIGQDWG